MADEHFFPAGDFPSGLLGTTDPCFFGSSGPYAPALDVTAPTFGMLPSSWAASAELTTVPADSFATAAQHFDSALSSLVSSPSARRASDSHDVAVLGDLIGRLGSIICVNTAASATNSCYSTPLSSPPRGVSPAPAALAPFRQGGIGGDGWCYPPPLETGGGGRLSRVASSKSLGGAAAAAAAAAAPAALENAAAEMEETMSPTAAGGTNSKTQTTPAHAGARSAARKRKASGRGRTAAASVCNGSPKRSKLVAGDGNEDVAAAAEDAGDAAEEQKKKPEPEPEPEPVKDYIHVRARRGQATDSHSLAERVRREKISERMNLLQSLVPGCNKITGKAVMLDEIINYVQSLQRQVEFLSMKLSTMNVVPHHHHHHHQQQQQQQLDGAGDDDDDEARYYLPAASASDDRDMMMLGYSGLDAAAAAFSSYGDPLFSTAMTTPHATTTMESCTSTSFHPAGGFNGGWDPAPAAQDLQSVVVVHRPQDQQQQQQQHRRHDGKR